MNDAVTAYPEQDDIYDLLPGILRELVDLIGLTATQQLVERYGGVRLYVPKQFDPDHALVKLIGPAATAKLVGAFGGQDHFDIPKALSATIAVRNAHIRAESKEFSQRALALKYNLTERQIRNILTGTEEDDGQGDLF